MDIDLLVQPETVIDWFILVVCAISAFTGMRGGFIKESISLAGWITAHFVAAVSAEPISASLGVSAPENSVLYLFGYGLIFASVVVFFTTVGAGLSAKVTNGPIKLGNSFLGGVFGGLRGIIAIAVLSLLVGLTLPDLQRDTFGASVYSVHLEIVEAFLRSGFESDLFLDPNGLLDDTVDDVNGITEVP